MRPPPEATLGGALRIVWTGDSETDCVEICRDLQLADIEYRVSQTPAGLSGRMGVSWKFAVAVSGSDYEAAKSALGLDGQVNDSTDATSGDVRPDEAKVRAGEYLKRWRPEDATIKVWSQSASDTSSIVGLSLTENLIRYRLSRSEDGTRKYFVRPEDETRAHEIIRDIEKGEPPS